MPVIELEQGSQAWLDYRKSRVMATDSPILLGSNPWKTELELWEEKLGFRPPVEMNDAMREGQRKEPIARALAIEMLGINFIPIVYESDTYPWIAASLDGISDCGKYILELKCPSKVKLYDQICEGYIPPYYMDQMQHQLATLPNVEHLLYGVYFPLKKEKPLVLIYVKRTPEKAEQIVKRTRYFYEQLCNMNPPVEWKFKEKK